MWFHVLACDYDGTLATAGRIASATLEALLRVRESGRRLVLVTGRQFDDLLHVCPEIEVFDLVVAENGAVLYDPRAKRVEDLADPPPAAFLRALEAEDVPFSTGRIIVSSVVPHEGAVLDAIKRLGLELHIIFNKEAVMVLPSAHRRLGETAGPVRCVPSTSLRVLTSARFGHIGQDYLSGQAVGTPTSRYCDDDTLRRHTVGIDPASGPRAATGPRPRRPGCLCLGLDMWTHLLWSPHAGCRLLTCSCSLTRRVTSTYNMLHAQASTAIQVSCRPLFEHIY